MAENGKPKVAFFDFACCEGCQLTVVDSLQTHLELVEAVQIIQFRTFKFVNKHFRLTHFYDSFARQ